MDSKGQFSLDLIMAVIAFIIAVQMILAIAGSFEESQKNLSIQNQERDMAELVAAKLSMIPMLDFGTAQVNFQIPYLLIPGKPRQDCIIEVSKADNKISVYYPSKTAADKIQAEVAFRADTLPASFGNILSLACGQSVSCSNALGSWSCS